MKEVPIYEIKEDIALRYAPIADEIRNNLKEKKTYLLNPQEVEKPLSLST